MTDEVDLPLVADRNGIDAGWRRIGRRRRRHPDGRLGRDDHRPAGLGAAAGRIDLVLIGGVSSVVVDRLD